MPSQELSVQERHVCSSSGQGEVVRHKHVAVASASVPPGLKDDCITWVTLGDCDLPSVKTPARGSLTPMSR
jgi:hypothetical protein